MALDVATLAVKVDTRELERGNVELQKFAQSGDGAGNSAAGMVAKFSQLRKETAGYTKEQKALRASIDPLYAQFTRYDAKVDELNRALRSGAINAGQYRAAMAQVRGAVAGNANALDKLTAGAGGTTYVLRNLAYQFNQVGQQGAVTGNFLGAMAVQLPDILSSFGSFKLVLLGGALALGSAFIPGLFGASAGAKELEDSVDNLTDSVSSFRSSLDEAQRDLVDLREEYGENAKAARELNMAIAEFEAAKALQALNDTTEELGSALKRLRLDSYYVSEGISQHFDRLEKKWGLSTSQIEKAVKALDDLESATGPEQATEAARQLSLILMSARDESGKIPERLVEAATQAKNAAVQALRLGGHLEEAERLAALIESADIAAGIGDGANEAMRLAENLAAAGRALSSLQSGINSLNVGNIGKTAQLAALQAGQSKTEATIQGKLAERRAELGAALGAEDAIVREAARQQVDAYEQALREEAALVDQIDILTTPDKPARSGGGTASKQADAAQRVLDGLRAEIELIGMSEQARRTYQAVQRAGVDLYSAEGQQIADLVEELIRLEEKQEGLTYWADTISTSFADAFHSAITGAESFEEAFRNMAASILADLAKMIVQQTIYNALASVFGIPGMSSAPISVLGIGANARGTDYWKGGLTRVNEEGGEIMNLPRGTQIIPHDISKRMADGSGQNVTNKIVNVLDPSLVGQYLETSQGERLVMNIITRNRGALANA